MDRNTDKRHPEVLELVVALRKESVDRNQDTASSRSALRPSLSARRAWIEILARASSAAWISVALRKESVDRNNQGYTRRTVFRVALRKESVDRNLAWHCIREDVSVALRKESVDRNTNPVLNA